MSPLSRWIVLAALVIALFILWRLSSRTVAPISFTEAGMLLQNGACRLHLPLKKIERESFTADVLSIERTIATFPNGYRVVDEKISMPENYTFGKALSAVVKAVFGLDDLQRVVENRKMVLFEGMGKNGEKLRILAVFKGKKDLELLYPLNDSFFLTIKRCLIEKREPKEPTVVNHVVGKEPQELPLTRWSQELFDLDILINKDM